MTSGRNNGIAGILDIAVGGSLTGGSLTTMRYAVNVTRGWSWKAAMAAINRTGRSNRPRIRLGDFTGAGAVEGKVQADEKPFHPNTQYATGTLTIGMIQVGDGSVTCGVAIPCRVPSLTFTREITANGKGSGNDIWNMDAEWQYDASLGAIALTWAGQTITLSAPSPNDQETDQGLSKVYDANNLQTAATQRIDCEGISDTDAAEVTKLAAYVGAAIAPMTGLQVTTARWLRTDTAGGVIEVTWALNNTKQAVEFPQTTTVTDPQNLQSRAAIAKVNNTGTQTLSGFTPRSVANTNLTPSSTLTLTELGLRNTKEDVEFPNTFVNVDPYGLTTEGKKTSVYDGAAPADPTPPSGTKIIGKTTLQLTSAGVPENQIQWDFSTLSSVDRVVYPETVTTVDPQNLQSHATIARVDDLGTATLSGYAARAVETKNLTDSHTVTITSLGLRSTKDDIELPGTYVDTDPYGLDTQGKKTSVYTGSAPADPTPPTGTKIIGKTTLGLTSAGTPEKQIVWTFGELSSVDRLTFPRTSEYRSAQAPWQSLQASTITASGSMATQASSLWASFQGVNYAKGLRLVPVTDGTRMVIYEYVDPGILLEGLTTGGGRWIEARLNGSDVEVYVTSNLSQGNGIRRLTFSRQKISGLPVRRFIMRMQISGTTIPEEYPSKINSQDMPLIGDTNSSTFLGLPAGTCVYEGPVYALNITLAGTITFFMGYQFRADANGIVGGMPQEYFLRPVSIATASTLGMSTPTWVNAGSLGLSDVLVPNSSSFVAFEQTPPLYAT